MALFLVAYTDHEIQFLGGAIVESFDEVLARRRCEEIGISRPGAISTVVQLDPATVPPKLVGRYLDMAEIHALVGKKKPPAPSV